jgi:hypothetical protein
MPSKARRRRGQAGAAVVTAPVSASRLPAPTLPYWHALYAAAMKSNASTSRRVARPS